MNLIFRFILKSKDMLSKISKIGRLFAGKLMPMMSKGQIGQKRPIVGTNQMKG